MRFAACHQESDFKTKKDALRLSFVTNLDDMDLGDDLRLQLAWRRLIPIKPWESVKQLFQARQLDGSVFKKPWLADVLINKAPSAGYAVASNGFLTVERVWQEVLSLQLNFNTSRPDAADIIEWSLAQNHVSLLKELDDGQFRDICEWIENGSESLEVLLLTLLKNDISCNLLSLGLAFEVTRAEVGKEKTALWEAAIRLEKYTGDKPMLPNRVDQFVDASKRVHQKLAAANKKEQLLEARDKLDQLLAEVGVQDFAWLSSVAIKGFEQRLIRFANSADNFLDNARKPHFKQLVELLAHAESHWMALKFSKRLEQMRMALRLLRWLIFENGHDRRAPSFAKAARQYVREGGFIDRARDSLRTGDECPKLNKLYTKLIKKVEAIRHIQNEHFASLLKQWTAARSQGEELLKIENFLDDIVSPIAKDHRLLLIVMDGMNHAVFSELIEDMVEKNDWVELTHPDWAPRKPVIAALPTVTEVSRRSLLCGKLTASPKDDEHIAALRQ
jgi:hypothetical protein